uniref:Uncharacterized protein n=1 Tax=Tanacetum cinerariifolium TaxID=118510 RepID=A0A699QXM5_TANCI|nr:hypothetical protein [Tanacetum cinerariifolium]
MFQHFCFISFINEHFSALSLSLMLTGESFPVQKALPDPPRKDSPVSINVKDKAEKRSFTKEIKQKCWSMAETVQGRDPDGWRKDAVGGLSDLDNMQILQTQVNRKKSDNVLDKYILKGF